MISHAICHYLREMGLKTEAKTLIQSVKGLEYIIQLAGRGPSHIIVPSVHLKKEEIAALFSGKLDINAPTDPIELARIAREVSREKFLNAEMGISGGNFLVAETRVA